MIIVGTRKIKLINPMKVIEVELVKGKGTIFAEGSTDDKGQVTVARYDVKAPFSVVIKTAVSTNYINCNTFNDAVEELRFVLFKMGINDVQKIVESYRKLYKQ